MNQTPSARLEAAQDAVTETAATYIIERVMQRTRYPASTLLAMEEQLRQFLEAQLRVIKIHEQRGKRVK